MLRIKSKVLKTGPKAYHHQFVLSSFFPCLGLCTGSSLCPQTLPHTNITLITKIDSSFMSWRKYHLSFVSSPNTLCFSFGVQHSYICDYLFICLVLSVLSVPLRPGMGVFCASLYPHYLSTPGTQQIFNKQKQHFEGHSKKYTQHWHYRDIYVCVCVSIIYSFSTFRI